MKLNENSFLYPEKNIRHGHIRQVRWAMSHIDFVIYELSSLNHG